MPPWHFKNSCEKSGSTLELPAPVMAPAAGTTALICLFSSLPSHLKEGALILSMCY